MAGKETFLVWGELLCLGDMASSGSSPIRLELQTLWHTLILSEQTAEENLQAATGDTAGAVLCPRLQSCVPLGVLAASTALTVCPFLSSSLTMAEERQEVAHGHIQSTAHTDLRHLQQSALSLLCSYPPDAIITY